MPVGREMGIFEPIGQFELGPKQGEKSNKGFVLTNYFMEVCGKTEKKPFATEQPSRH